MAYQSDNFANAARFGLDLKKWIVKQQGNLEAKVKKVAITIHNDVIFLTRVDTGRARSNWNVALNDPDPSIVEPPQEWHANRKGHVNGTPLHELAGSESVAKQVVLASYKLSDIIYISNSVPYIGYLEYGTDRTQADHMVLTALQNAETMLQSNP
jgi:hypothetical protein